MRGSWRKKKRGPVTSENTYKLRHVVAAVVETRAPEPRAERKNLRVGNAVMGLDKSRVGVRTSYRKSSLTARSSGHTAPRTNPVQDQSCTAGKERRKKKNSIGLAQGDQTCARNKKISRVCYLVDRVIAAVHEQRTAAAKGEAKEQK